MRKNIFTTIALTFMSTFLYAQTGNIGINTTIPTETLDVNGTSNTNSLYIRNPGEPTMTGGHFLATSKNSLEIYDPTLESSGLFNYIKLTLTGVPAAGIEDYDTKIDAANFLVSLHNYSFKLEDGTPQVALDYNDNGIDDDKQGSPEVIAFKKNGTWHIKARFTNSRLIAFTTDFPERTYNNFTIDLYLMAYKKLISKHNINEINIDLGGMDGSGKTLDKPSGF